MNVEVTQTPIEETSADLLVVGLCEEEDLPASLAGAAGSGEAKSAFKKLAMLYPERGGRALVVGLGKAEELDAERARIAAAIAAKEAGRLEAGT
ncbi:MAG TPA: hypothetical protein VG518_00125, partial [Solirubrobacterales bacterium]|nr:hypothetical protein [Solirubrobacterales bacterium]